MRMEELLRQADFDLTLGIRWAQDELTLHFSYTSLERAQQRIADYLKTGATMPPEITAKNERLAATLYSPATIEKALSRASAFCRTGDQYNAVHLYDQLSRVTSELPEHAEVEFEGALIGILRRELRAAHNYIHNSYDPFNIAGTGSFEVVRDYRDIAQRNGIALPRDVMTYYAHVEFELLSPPRKLWRSMLGKKPPAP